MFKCISTYFYRKIKRRRQGSIIEATTCAVASPGSDPIDLLRPAKIAADSECSISSVMVLLEPRPEHRIMKNPFFRKIKIFAGLRKSIGSLPALAIAQAVASILELWLLLFVFRRKCLKTQKIGASWC